MEEFELLFTTGLPLAEGHVLLLPSQFSFVHGVVLSKFGRFLFGFVWFFFCFFFVPTWNRGFKT